MRRYRYLGTGSDDNLGWIGAAFLDVEVMSTTNWPYSDACACDGPQYWYRIDTNIAYLSVLGPRKRGKLGWFLGFLGENMDLHPVKVRALTECKGPGTKNDLTLGWYGARARLDVEVLKLRVARCTTAVVHCARERYFVRERQRAVVLNLVLN